MMASSDTKPDFRKIIPWKLAVIFLLFSAVIILTGAYYYRTQRNRIFTEQENNLSVIATLKINQIQQWHSERLADAYLIRDDKPLIRFITHFLNKNNNDELNELSVWMKSVCSMNDYSNVLLVDSLLNVRFTVVKSDSVVGEAIIEGLKDVLVNDKIVMTDLHRSKSVPLVHMDILIPLIDSSKNKLSRVGTIVLRIDPQRILFPLVQSWPTPSKSSETLLLRMENDSVVYLNELRHRKNTELNLKFPLSERNLLASKVVNGFEGVTEGVDYRNIPVVGALNKISGLPWYMVAKVDKEEILLPLRRYLFMTIIIISLLIFINGSAIGFWTRDQRIKMYRLQLKDEIAIHESEERFNTSFMMSPVSVTISSIADNKFIDVNNTFLKDIEYTREEVIGKTPLELGIWANEAERLWIINEIKERETIFGKVISYRSKTGKIIYGLTSMSVVKVNGEYCNLSTVVNITDSKIAEEKVIESEELFRKLFDNMLNGFAYCRMIYEDGHPSDFLYITVNEAFGSLTGLKHVEGKRVSEAIPGIQKTDPELLERYGRVASTGKPEVFEIYVESLKMWFSISVYCPKKEYFVAVFDVITHRKLGEAALRESEERFRSLYENVTIGIYRTTLDGQILLANPAMVSMLGFDTFEQLAQRNLLQEGYEPDYPRSKFLKTIENDGKIIGLESAWNRKDGKALFVRESANAVRDDSGRILYYDGTVEDITDRKKIEDALHENEKRLREAQEMSHLGFWLWDIKSGNVEWSDEVFKIFWLDPKTFKPKIVSILEMSPWPENNQRDKELINRAMESHNPGTYEQKFLRPDKSIGYYYSTFRGNYDNNGELISIVGTVLDITERKQTEEALRESEERFRSMANSIPQLAWVANADGFIYWYNQRWYDYTGTKPEQMEGWGWQIVHDPEVLPTVMEKWTGSIASGKAFEMSFPLRGADGKFRTFLTRVEPWKDSEGRVRQWFGTNTDVETLKQAEEIINKLNEELEQKVMQRTELLEAANKELEAFSYSVSHDLRAPLRSVHGFTKILLEDYASKLDDEGKRICGIISTSATQMGELIDDLLSFSKIGRSGLNPSEIDMKKMAKLIFEGMTSPAERKRIKLNIGKLHKAFGDVTLFGQVWINLISNAIKYSSKNDVSEIKIGSQTDGKMITYFIKDNGVGFDMQYTNKLFGVFQRLHSESEFEGNGVGLAIVQRIVLKHGGKVWAEGEPGKGATFYFSLSLNGEGGKKQVLRS
jgi:PAS domain S-box-containing protein